ncbi:hypothetical protein [Pseudonocardia sp. H11422]|uniref:hypothetical protein n=1 Tax=Pseudonocardia sp. H11422 TaxID=2835866 RepID=UPI001BDD44F7|nr:hypothetical protein [Pseudonocardia sp. H11422]
MSPGPARSRRWVLWVLVAPLLAGGCGVTAQSSPVRLTDIPNLPLVTPTVSVRRSPPPPEPPAPAMTTAPPASPTAVSAPDPVTTTPTR